MSTSPKEFHKLIKNIGDSSGIIASRYLKKSKVNPKQSPLRIIFSRVFNLIIRIFFSLKYSDTQCGAKIFKKEALKEIIPRIKTIGFLIDIDILYNLKKKGYKIREFPTVWENREDSSISLKKHWKEIINSLLKIRFNLRE